MRLHNFKTFDIWYIKSVQIINISENTGRYTPSKCLFEYIFADLLFNVYKFY